MSRPLPIPSLRSWSAVLVTGEDARKYLQGQLSNDVRKLTPERALLAGCTSAQGRVLTLVTLIDRPEGSFMIMPADALEPTLARMRRMLLRAKVTFQEQPEDWALAPVSAALAGELFDRLPESAGHCLMGEHASLVRWWSADARYLLLARRAQLGLLEDESGALDAQWQRADVAAGLPAVYAATRESFVPQMLNLDLLHGLSYDKGCYVGQEVVARARRAQVKRRMFRFGAACAPPAPGTRVLRANADAGEVVDAAATPAGCELLAVVDVERGPLALSLPGGAALSPLELPYPSA